LLLAETANGLNDAQNEEKKKKSCFTDLEKKEETLDVTFNKLTKEFVWRFAWFEGLKTDTSRHGGFRHLSKLSNNENTTSTNQTNCHKLSVLDQSLQHHKTRMEKLKNQKLIWLVKS
jgi:hypothetical protein